MTNAPFYVSNTTLHTHLQQPTVNQQTRTLYSNLHNKLNGHTNRLINEMATADMPSRRHLKRSWMRDLVSLIWEPRDDRDYFPMSLCQPKMPFLLNLIHITFDDCGRSSEVLMKILRERKKLL